MHLWKKLKIFLGVVFLLTLTGCATGYGNLKPGISSINFTKNGVVVGSVQETSPGRLSGGIYFYFKNTDTGKKGVFATRNPFVRQDNDFKKKNTRGGVFAIALPPGSYEIDDWLINNGTGAEIYPREPKKAPFEVEAGKVTYIGNLNMFLRTGNNALGIEIVSGGYPIIGNGTDRDIPLLRKKYPFLTDKKIDIKIIKYSD